MCCKHVVIADRWFPSSKTCSECGHKVDELPLSVREWECPNCHTHHDRDVNAAINLKKYGLEHYYGATPDTPAAPPATASLSPHDDLTNNTASSAEISAYGVESSVGDDN